MTQYEILDLRTGSDGERRTAAGHTPAQVAAAVLGETVIRSGTSSNLVAKVYFKSSDGMTNMVRFYRTVDNSTHVSA